MKRSSVYYIDTRIVFLQIAIAILTVIAGVRYVKWIEINCIEFGSDKLDSVWVISDKKQIKSVVNNLKRSKKTVGVVPRGDYYLRLKSDRQTQVYLFDDENSMYESNKKITINPSEGLKIVIKKAQRELKLRSPYGELADWNEVKYIFPQGSYALITDVDTGKSFNAERKSGITHADIRSVSQKDQETLCKIFGGEWSWKRRAVTVKLGNRKVAASLTGMSHWQNGESGLFDLRFPLTGGDKKADSMSNRMMYLKAAGKLEETLAEVSPGTTILYLFTAIDQKDWSTVKLILADPNVGKPWHFDNLIGITVYGLKKNGDSRFELNTSISFKQGPYNQKRKVFINLVKNRTKGYYQASPEFLSSLKP